MTKLRQTRDAYGEALVEVGRIHPEVVVLDADLYKSTRTIWFRDAYPNRFVDVGISEMDMVSMGAGLAASGLVTCRRGRAQASLQMRTSPFTATHRMKINQ